MCPALSLFVITSSLAKTRVSRRLPSYQGCSGRARVIRSAMYASHAFRLKHAPSLRSAYSRIWQIRMSRALVLPWT
jgi:hypothetical protein